MAYRIGSFNCLNFSRNSSKNVNIFAQIIKDTRMDIVALQEIVHKEALNGILRYLGNGWDGEFNEGMNASEYAFIWNTRRVRPVTTEVGGDSRVSRPRIYNQYKKDRGRGQIELARNPYFGRFTPEGCLGGAHFEIRILNAHVRFSKGKSDLSIGEIEMRKNEVDILAKTIYPKAADKVYGNNMPAYTILLGDYNLNKIDSGAKSPYIREEFSEIVDGRSIKQIITVQSELTTLKKSPEEESDYANNFDHFTYDQKRYEGTMVRISRIDAVRKYCNGDIEKYRKEVSDHVPILIELELNPRR